MSILGWLETLLPRGGARSSAAPDGTPVSPCAVPDADTRDAFDAGLAAYASREYATSIECFGRVIALRHDDADAHNNLGLSQLALGNGEDALDSFVLALHFRPQFAQAFYNMALAAHLLGDLGQVVTSLERAIELQPDFAVAHNMLGYVLSHEAGEFERGAAHIRRALELAPMDPDVRCNYSAVLTREGGAAQALAICDELLAAHPAMHEARLNRALAGLKLGRFAEAWPNYEARKVARGNYVPRALPLPEWQGGSLRGRKLLVYAEQGIGDQIMFASCLPDLLPEVAACVIECAPQLVPVFKRSFPAAAIEAEGQGDANLARLAQSAGLDYQVAIGSLPGHLRRKLSDFPRHTGYLQAEPARVAYWKQRLDALGPGLKVGISWSGGAPSTQGESRSLPLPDWSPILAQPACHFVSLQYGRAGDDPQAASQQQRVTIHAWREANETYAETAALVAALDLVISVQTALIHLAGALGKPAWVMLRQASEWRYLEQGETMPWYPSVRLLRQRYPGDWGPVVEEVARGLAHVARR
jgi:tetratricopeptide (TPR) repeat protein